MTPPANIHRVFASGAMKAPKNKQTNKQTNIMTIKTGFDLNKLTADETRPAIAHPYLEIKNEGTDQAMGGLVTTNGSGMVFFDVPVDPTDVSGPIPISALKLAKSHIDWKTGGAHIRAEKHACIFPDGTALPRPSGIGFPGNWRQCCPGVYDTPLTIKLDVDLLMAIAKGLGTKKISITFEQTNPILRPAKVLPLDCKGSNPPYPKAEGRFCFLADRA